MLRCGLSLSRPSNGIASRGACRQCFRSVVVYQSSPSPRLHNSRTSLRTLRALRKRPSSRCSQTTCASSLLDQAWGTHINAQELATNIFSTSIIPYSAFLYYLTKSRKTPPLALFGFYFLLVFVFATIPAGVIALKVYNKSLANVDFLHGSAESMLTVTNLLIVLGLRQGVRQAEAAKSQDSLDGPAQASTQEPADAAKQQ